MLFIDGFVYKKETCAKCGCIIEAMHPVNVTCYLLLITGPPKC